MKTFDGYSKEKFSDTSVLLAGGGSKELSNFIGTLNWDSTNRKLQYKKIGDTNWRDLVTFGSNATNSTSYLPLAGGTMTGLLTTTSGGSHKGIKVGNTYINAINGDLIFQNNTAIRFGGDSWDYNVWAGLKYVHSSKIIYLGLADGSAFTANSAQSNGKLYLPGIANIYTGNGTNLVWHKGNDGSGSGLDADLLDGIHANGLFTAFSNAGSQTTRITIGGVTKDLKIDADTVDGMHANSFLLRGRMTNPSNGTSYHGAIPYTIALKAAGTPVYNDPEFASGTNSVSTYNNSGNSTVTISRIADNQGSANSSGYILKISTTSGTASPGRGGFYQNITARQNAVFAQIFRAKIPIGFSVVNAENSMGKGYTTYWLTDTAGTGKWEWYIRITICGNEGTYSGGGHVYLSGSGEVTWYLSYCNLIDLTKGNYDGLRTKYSDYTTQLQTARTLTIGNTGKSFNGSANVSWSLAEIGVSAAAHTHSVKINGATKTIAASNGAAVDLGNYLPLSGGTMSGNIILKGSTSTDMTYASNVHPYIRFDNADSSQNVSLIFTDKDAYRAPAGIKLIGNQGGEWFEARNIYATNFFYGALSGNASSATKLTSSAGSISLPIYFSDGKPVACTPASLFSNLSNSGNDISITVAGQNRTLTVNYANSSDKSNYLTSRYIGNNGDTVAQVKQKILDSYTSLSDKQGYTIKVNYLFMEKYSEDNYVIPANGQYFLIYLTPGYNGKTYGQWLATHAGSSRLYVFGRYDNQWTERKTIAWTSDIPTVTNYYWANIKVSSSSSTTTTPTFATATATTSVTTPLVSSTGRLTLNATNTALDLKFNNDNTKSVILNGTQFKPFDVANGKLDLGSTSARWKVVYGGSGNFTGDVISAVSNTNSVRHKVQNSNGAISILTSSNRGLYDETNSAWIIYLTQAADHVYVPKWAGKGSSTQPVYFNSNGEPIACTAYSGLLTTLSSSKDTNLSITVGGTTKSITDLRARKLALSSTTITSTTDDTTTKWGPLGTSVHFYSKTGQLIDQPSQQGFLLNVTGGSTEAHQIWMTQNTGSLYHRGGNASGWGGSWRTILDSSNYSSYLDSRYYTETEADNRFVNVTGDTITGTLTMSTGATIHLWDDSATASHRLTLRCASDVGRIYNYTGSAYGAMHVGHDGTNAIVITSGQNIGIGTGSPSSKLHVNGNAIATNLGVNASGGGNGISLYSGSGNVAIYGIAFNQTSNWGTHGYVTSDWATYFTMNNQNNRGWIFKRNGSGNVFSIDTSGQVYANGRINGNYYTSRVATGTQPYACTSTTLNTNLNADLLDGLHETSFYRYRGDYGKSYTATSTEYKLGPGTYKTQESGYSGTLLAFKSEGSASSIQFWTHFSQGNLYYRTSIDSNRWGKTNGEWTRILDSDNYTTYTVKKDGTGASGTWNINISGNATTANRLYTTSIGGSSDSHASALKNYFNSYKSSTPRNCAVSFYSSVYDNGSQYMGYFLSGYDSTPYGGFFVAHYDACYYVGIAGGNYNQQTIITSKNYSSYALPLSGGTCTGNIYAPHFYESSDIRYKKILRNLSITSNTIANLPLFDFEWIENNSIGTGTSAQAVQEILPNLVSGTDKLTLDYGVLGTIAGITACKELVNQKSEIEQLRERVAELEQKLNDYGIQ